jgi:hypothetical protein
MTKQLVSYIREIASTAQGSATGSDGPTKLYDGHLYIESSFSLSSWLAACWHDAPTKNSGIPQEIKQ